MIELPDLLVRFLRTLMQENVLSEMAVLLPEISLQEALFRLLLSEHVRYVDLRLNKEKIYAAGKENTPIDFEIIVIAFVPSLVI